MRSLSVGLVILLAVSAVHAEKWAILAQYTSSSCDHNKVYLFNSTAESACFYTGGSFYFWNCSDGNPQRMMCSDNKCTQSCVALPTLKYNSSACNPYGKSGIWYNGFCADMENPFPTNLKIKLTRRYFNETDCQQERSLMDILGASLECFNTSIGSILTSSYSTCNGGYIGLYLCSDAVCNLSCTGPFNRYNLRYCSLTMSNAGLHYDTESACGYSAIAPTPSLAAPTGASTTSDSPSPPPSSATSPTIVASPTPTTSGTVPITTGSRSASSALLVTLALATGTLLN